MSTLTIRLPDDKHQRVKALAEKRHISINKLIDELGHDRARQPRRVCASRLARRAAIQGEH
jgi:predicted transcriptional regulator